MPLKTERVKLRIRDRGALSEDIEKAKELLAKCADRKGESFVEKTGSDTMDVACIYEGEGEEPVVVELGDMKQEMDGQILLTLPKEMSEDMLDSSIKKMDELKKFVDDCIAKQGEVRLVKGGVSPTGEETVHVECWKIFSEERRGQAQMQG
ncbi:MAG: hypothetical protein QXI60_07460 [Thermofilaceae archaeon]